MFSLHRPWRCTLKERWPTLKMLNTPFQKQCECGKGCQILQESRLDNTVSPSNLLPELNCLNLPPRILTLAITPIIMNRRFRPSIFTQCKMVAFYISLFVIDSYIPVLLCVCGWLSALSGSDCPSLSSSVLLQCDRTHTHFL